MYKKICLLFAAIGLFITGTACATPPTALAQTQTQIPTRLQYAPCKLLARVHSNQLWANGSELSTVATLAMATQNLPTGPHIQHTPKGSQTAIDIQRSNTIMQNIRNNLSQYLDYCKAIQAGYIPVDPQIKQDVYQFAATNYAEPAGNTLDTAHPAALLYVKIDGIYQLIGVTFAAPANLSEKQLNMLFPGNIIPWFKQVNYCLPQKGQQLEKTSFNSITTAAACAKAGGKFTPQAYGWMIQIYAFGE